ncbi:hypothetical protein VNO80_22389 [Phaseolus coccineus]|uniref:Uncharacterized protein n=1 Tax=Phaseolus coccineus TaxID=3886 RepID=A0AAN9M433_PHACN
MRVCIYGVCVLYSSSTNNKEQTTKPRKKRELDRVRERERERKKASTVEGFPERRHARFQPTVLFLFASTYQIPKDMIEGFEN